MQVSDSILQAILSIGLLSSFILLVNLADKRTRLRPMLFVILALGNIFYGSNYLFKALLPTPAETPIPDESLPPLVFISLLTAILATLVMLPQVREWMARYLPHPNPTNSYGFERGFDPNSMVHMLAIIGCLYLVSTNTTSYILEGGLSGLAKNTPAVDVLSLLATTGIFLMVAFLGVGLGIRRGVSAIVRRLGLRAPTLEELAIAVGTAIMLVVLVFVFQIAWSLLTPEEIIKEQTQVSELISKSISTMTMAFMIGAAAAVGEEIFFRGALQPILGLWPTAIVFALIHSQYTLTPAALLILVVGLVFGWLRRRYNTTTAMVAHFLYNFAQAALLVIVRSSLT
jgi:membrane protease YdiL (CAAX protease family)